MLIDFERRCWAEIDLDNIRYNYKFISNKAGSSQVMAVVKANAYGHGDAICSVALQEAGAQRFAVSGLSEAVNLRKSGIKKPILILGYTSPKQAMLIKKYDLEQCVYSLEYAEKLSETLVKINANIKCHFKVDTGMGRLGFNEKDNLNSAVEEICKAYDLPGFIPEGIFTHFSVADSLVKANEEYTVNQYTHFTNIVNELKLRGKKFNVKHCCNSAGMIMHPEMHMDMVRPGIILYGCNPSEEIEIKEIKPAFCLKTIVAMVKNIKKGDHVSYGRTFTAKKDMRVATLAVGYADGYPRAMSGCGLVSICGKPAKVIGKVCMDQMVVDVSDIPGAKLGSVATVFGGEEADSIDDVAKKSGTINYEILCNIGRRVQRVYIEKGEETRLADYTGDGNSRA